MNRGRNSVVVATALAAACGFGFVVYDAGRLNLVSSALADEARACSVHSLKGVYGIKFEGVRLGEPIQHYNSVSLMTFDGHGTFTVSEIARFEGQPVARTFTGPYTVNADCSGFVDYTTNLTNPPHRAHGAFVIVDQGRGLFFLDDEENWAAGGVGRKL